MRDQTVTLSLKVDAASNIQMSINLDPPDMNPALLGMLTTYLNDAVDRQRIHQMAEQGVLSALAKLQGGAAQPGLIIPQSPLPPYGPNGPGPIGPFDPRR